jgi:hypothetical protein
MLSPCACLHHRAASLARFEGKVFSLLYSKFQKVLMLDCDLVPLMDPDMLFNSPDFVANGNLFWPDIWQNWVSPEIYDIIGLTPDVMVGGWRGLVQPWVPGGRHCYRSAMGALDLTSTTLQYRLAALQAGCAAMCQRSRLACGWNPSTHAHALLPSKLTVCPLAPRAAHPGAGPRHHAT